MLAALIAEHAQFFSDFFITFFVVGCDSVRFIANFTSPCRELTFSSGHNSEIINLREEFISNWLQVKKNCPQL
jgi:hypothetical protein